MRIVIGSDHAGFPLKEGLTAYIRQLGHEVVDVGTHGTEPVDYPDYAEALGKALLGGQAERGVLICGSGVGASVAANKLPGIRAGLCHDTYSAHQGVEHDAMNVLVLGGRVIGPELAHELVKANLGATFTGEERHLRRLEKVHALEGRLRALQGCGQSVWLDYIRRSLLTCGELARLIDADGLRGVTSNPSIFEKAITGSTDYVEILRSLAPQFRDAKSLYEQVAIRDIQDAADVLRPVYEETQARDGYVSLEVSPHLARDTSGTLAEARRLWQQVERPNLMIKVPATPEGMPAIEQLISEGINVNVTLLFAQEAYEQVVRAYIAGLERRAEQGGDLHHVASVASFFISRIDTAVDAMLNERLKTATSAGEQALLRSLLGKVAIANAKQTYQRYQELFRGPRWQALASKGAQTQRVLWASTSTKNPAYRYGNDRLFAYIRLESAPDAAQDAGVEALAAAGQPVVRIGLAFANDTDHDRHGIVTRSAGLLNPNHYLAVAIAYLLSHRPNWRADAAVGKTVVSSSLIDHVTARLGRRLVEVPVGFKWFVEGLLDGSVGFAGEESAGASFLRFDGSVWTTDKDGIILGLLAAEMLAITGRDPGELYRDLTRELGEPVYERLDAPATPEQKEVLQHLSPQQIQAAELAGEPILAMLTEAPGNGSAIGGLKVITANGWFAARPSGTEDVYKIYAESFRDADHVRQIQDEAQALIAKVSAAVKAQ